LRTFLPNANRARGADRQPDDWSAFVRLSIYIIVRSMSYIGLVAFIPLYFVHVLQTSPSVANLALTAYLACGVLGTLVGGPAADRIGRRPVIYVATGLTFVFITILAVVVGDGGGLGAGFVLVALTGSVITGSTAAQIVLGQEYLPNRMGVASGVTLGLAVSLGGMFSPVLGAIGDRYGLQMTMVALAALAGIAFALSFMLPLPAKRRALLAARAVVA
jgi:FSR family fosmidomycin resistance protein-like MFS transporter